MDKIVGGIVPSQYIRPVKEGLIDALSSGLRFGYPAIDIKATLFDGSYHEVDSSEAAFKIAAALAFHEASRKCNPTLLEPIMKIEITIPIEYLGDVMGNITAKRGRIEGIEARGPAQIIKALVPLAEMFGYATSLRSLTAGRGTFSMEFDSYEIVPAAILKKWEEY